MDKQPNLPYLVDQVKFLFIPSRGLSFVTMHGLIKITQICLPKETRDYPISLILKAWFVVMFQHPRCSLCSQVQPSLASCATGSSSLSLSECVIDNIRLLDHISSLWCHVFTHSFYSPAVNRKQFEHSVEISASRDCAHQCCTYADGNRAP